MVNLNRQRMVNLNRHRVVSLTEYYTHGAEKANKNKDMPGKSLIEVTERQ
jgi:hypothetical protein